MNQTKNSKNIVIILILAVFSIGFIYACDSGSDEQFSGNTLQISLSCPDIDAAARQARDAGADRTFNDIVTLLLTVEGGNPPLSQISEEFDPDEPQILIDVPAGTDRLFTIIGSDINDNIICRGETETDINVNIVDIDIPCDFVIEDCIDGIDNDFDDLIDCEDPDCDENCMDPEEPVDPVPPPGDDDDDEMPIEPEDCSDGIDNDGDGFIDCADQDCLRFLECFNTPPSSPPPPSNNCNCQDEEIPSECNCICFPCEFECEECNYEFLQLPAFCSDPQQN